MSTGYRLRDSWVRWREAAGTSTRWARCEFRGSGLGRALLLTSFGEFHARGSRKVMLGVDADNHTGAVELYQSLGMSVVIEGLLYELP